MARLEALTRGVLRLMAAVIHALWERQDASLLILPASVPMDDSGVLFELTRYLEDPWVPVIEKDVDTAHSVPLQIDRNHPNLGRYLACRWVARTIYLGSARYPAGTGSRRPTGPRYGHCGDGKAAACRAEPAWRV